jgi:hypothetical protein
MKKVKLIFLNNSPSLLITVTRNNHVLIVYISIYSPLVPTKHSFPHTHTHVDTDTHIGNCCTAFAFVYPRFFFFSFYLEDFPTVYP